MKGQPRGRKVPQSSGAALTCPPARRCRRRGVPGASSPPPNSSPGPPRPAPLPPPGGEGCGTPPEPGAAPRGVGRGLGASPAARSGRAGRSGRVRPPRCEAEVVKGKAGFFVFRGRGALGGCEMRRVPNVSPPRCRRSGRAAPGMGLGCCRRASAPGEHGKCRQGALKRSLGQHEGPGGLFVTWR